MPPNPIDKLTTLARDTTRGITATPGSAAWQRDMERMIKTAHRAAYYAAQAQRLQVSVATLKGLSKAERADLDKVVKSQLGYLKDFATAAPDMSEAAVKARADMYAGAIKETYGMARYPGLPFYPTQGSECLTNCKCEWQDNGDGSYTWVLSAKESCPTCEARAAANPYQIEAS